MKISLSQPTRSLNYFRSPPHPAAGGGGVGACLVPAAGLSRGGGLAVGAGSAGEQGWPFCTSSSAALGSGLGRAMVFLFVSST